jgi:hypothetical protein
MATTIRELCLAAIFTALTGITGVKAFRNRSSIIDPEELPAVVLYDPSMNTDISNEFGSFRIVTMTVDVEAHVTAADDGALGAALNDLYGKVVNALQADASLGGNAIDCREMGIAQADPSKDDGADPRMGAVIQFEVQYQTDARDPTSFGVG